MGDYNKLIVSCTVRVPDRKVLEQKIEELGLYDSAYQSQEHIESIQESTWDSKKDILNLILVGQTKYGRGQKEFLDWLEPFVVQGSGENEMWAFQMSEYCTSPTVRALRKEET